MKKKSVKGFRTGKRILIWGMMAVMALSAKLPAAAAVTGADLANPVVDESTHIMYGSHEVNYKYIYFGLFPQKEIWGDELTDAIRNAAYDKNGVGWVNGRKYQRMSYDMIPEDINITRERWNHYCPEGYLYFLYEPVKWRILENNNGTLFLLSDKALDARRYDSGYSATWETSELRKWLNDDGSKEVTYISSKHYDTPGILLRGFTAEERSRIKITHLQQDVNPEYGTSNGADTEDKVFILNYTESTNIKYGFCDVKRSSRNCSSRDIANTDYAMRMHPYGYFGREDFAEFVATPNGSWLRTKGEDSFTEMRMIKEMDKGWQVNTTQTVVPAMKISCAPAECIRISFVTNTNTGVEEQIMLGSNYAKEPEALTKTGYKFTGWYTDAACTQTYAFNEKLTKDTVLYAGWEKEPLPEDSTIKDAGAVYSVISSEHRTVEYRGTAKGKQAKKATIPATITYDGITYQVAAVGEKAFKNNKKLKTVTIGKNVTQIKAEAFRGCTKLKNVTIGKNVTQIRAKAFMGCKSLETIAVGRKMKTIGAEAFRGCKKLRLITFKTTKLKAVGKNAFYQVNNKAKFKVPKKKYKAYKKLLAKKKTGYAKTMKIKKY
ncbi:MAG: leucine-rich repeat protein [Bacteroidales bacterium]|nr:leucine-rich repeat protein [Clostridium sp.]MCM1204252.1 leucine-rich repeat protein [Bacteroidales bacterium]